MAIHFFSEDVPFELPEKLRRKRWLKSLATTAGYRVQELNYVFCSDEYLFQMNVDYLNHDTYTDIITFDLSESKKGTIAAEIYISYDRVKDNATQMKTPISKELHRVIFHGLLHLLGYKDKLKKDQNRMREMEDKLLTKYFC